MNTLNVVNKQSLLDIALEQTGTLEGVVAIALENDLSITDELAYGDSLIIPDYPDSITEIVTYLQNRNIRPVSALSDDDFNILTLQDECKLCKCFK